MGTRGLWPEFAMGFRSLEIRQLASSYRRAKRPRNLFVTRVSKSAEFLLEICVCTVSRRALRNRALVFGQGPWAKSSDPVGSGMTHEIPGNGTPVPVIPKNGQPHWFMCELYPQYSLTDHVCARRRCRLRGRLPSQWRPDSSEFDSSRFRGDDGSVSISGKSEIVESALGP